MCDVFLFRDLGVFELVIRGEVCGTDAGDVIGLVVRHLPERSAAIVDLSEVEDLDHDAALAFVDAMDLRHIDLVNFAVVVGHPSVRSVLVGAGAEGVAVLVGSANSARQALSHALELIAMPLSA
jgi:anti-anti-sigma regulatory factor